MAAALRPRSSLPSSSLVMALPLVGLFFFRIYENQLIRQTEAELIAQGAAIAAIYAHEGAARPALPPEKLGALMPRRPHTARRSRRLSLQADRAAPRPRLRQRSTDTAGCHRRPQPTLPSRRSARGLSGILADTQKTTLAGFRLLDPSGVVIAGREDVGRSFADVEEVRAALAGRYASALSAASSATQPAPPLYSVSRGTGVRVFVALPVVVDGSVAGVVYLSRTPNNIVKHLYGERGKVMLAAISILGAHVADRLCLAAHDQPANAMS